MRTLIVLSGLWTGCHHAVEPEVSTETCEQEPEPIGFTRPDGAELFARVWIPDDPRSAHGDGLGPVWNADSCAACHHQGGVGGAGPLSANVRLDGSGRILHKNGANRPGLLEGLDLGSLLGSGLQVHVPAHWGTGGWGHSGRHGVRRERLVSGPRFLERNTPALFGMGILDTVSESDMWVAGVVGNRAHPEVTGRVARDGSGAPGRFGWKGQISTLDDFVVAACGNELGLDTPTLSQPTRWTSEAIPGHDLVTSEVVALGDFVAELPVPRRVASAASDRGLDRFREVGCTSCHTETLGDAVGVYSDLLLHDLGPGLRDEVHSYRGPRPVMAGPDGARPQEWRTPPLWGIADSAPYLHDGRAETLEDAIAAHGGEAREIRAAFRSLPDSDREDLLRFLESLRAPDSDSVEGNRDADVVAAIRRDPVHEP